MRIGLGSRLHGAGGDPASPKERTYGAGAFAGSGNNGFDGRAPPVDLESIGGDVPSIDERPQSMIFQRADAGRLIDGISFDREIRAVFGNARIPTEGNRITESGWFSIVEVDGIRAGALKSPVLENPGHFPVT